MHGWEVPEPTWGAKTVTRAAEKGSKATAALAHGAGSVLGAPLRAAAAGGAALAHGVGSVLGAPPAAAARWLGKSVVGMAARAPGHMAMPALLAGLIHGSDGTTRSLAQQQAARAMSNQARHMVKVTHMKPLPDADLKAYIRARSVLEKTAVRRITRPELAKVLKEAVSEGVQAGKKERTPLKKQRVGGPGGYSPVEILKAGLILGGAGAVAGLGTQMLGKGVGEVGDLVHRMGRERHYNSMVAADPELKKYPKNEVKRVFNVIHRASPYVSKEPLLAANTVRSIIDTPRASLGSRTPVISLDAISNVLGLESGRQGTRYPFMQETKGRPEADLKGTTGIIG